MKKFYMVITGNGDAFADAVTEALNVGWSLHGSTVVMDDADGVPQLAQPMTTCINEERASKFKEQRERAIKARS